MLIPIIEAPYDGFFIYVYTIYFVSFVLLFISDKPAENSTIDNTSVDKENVHINITVSEVYPVPVCSVEITVSDIVFLKRGML